MVTWVLEKNVFSEEYFYRMVDYFQGKKIPYHILTIKPFIHEVDGKIPIIKDKVVVYGSLGLQKLAKKQYWWPGVWTNSDFDETVLSKKLGRDFLNYGCIEIKFRDVLKETPWNLFFIKPNTDTKEFVGTVLSIDRFEEWKNKLLSMGYFQDNILDTDVIISSVKALGCEWRLIIVDGIVSVYSCYRQYQRVMPELWCPNKVIQFAEEIAKKHSPAPVFTCDVAETEEGLKVVEYNSFNSSGLYKCEVEKLIDDINYFVDSNL